MDGRENVTYGERKEPFHWRWSYDFFLVFRVSGALLGESCGEVSPRAGTPPPSTRGA
ncbi:hypothetical protein HanIR_Chr15g0766331 [Helianthus annuus]|nr:hypothetical protein HanIR_Chr15g0766331 [Helianthus annuus]